MAFDLTAADPLMKIHFAPRIERQFNQAAIFYNKIMPGRGIPISNRGYEIPIHTAGNPTGTFYDDGGTLPAGQGESLQRSLALYKRYALAVGFSGDALDATMDDAVAYARSLAFNIKNATLIAIKDINIYTWLDGTGFIGLVNGALDISSTTVNSTLDVSGSSDGSRYFRKGMLIDVFSGTTSTIRGTIQVIAVPSSTTLTTIAISGAGLASTTTGDALARTGTYNKAFTGLKTLVDDAATVVQGVDRSLVPEFKANVLSLSGTPPLARDHLRRAIASINISLGAVNRSNLELWSYESQLQAYADMGWPMKRFMGGGAGKLDLGFTTYEWEGIPWYVDTDAPKDMVFLLDPETLFKVQARPLGFDDRTGNILRQVPSNTAGRYDDKFVAFLVARHNNGIYVPRANTKIKGLAIPSGY